MFIQGVYTGILYLGEMENNEKKTKISVLVILMTQTKYDTEKKQLHLGLEPQVPVGGWLGIAFGLHTLRGSKRFTNIIGLFVTLERFTFL